MDYQECDKDQLIEDFNEYTEYIHALDNAGELHTEIVPLGIPRELKETKRVFCHRGCYATSHLHDYCFHWESNQRKSFQMKELLAEREPEGCKEKYRGIMERSAKDKPADLNWRKSWKYKNWKSGKYKRLGGKVWKSL